MSLNLRIVFKIFVNGLLALSVAACENQFAAFSNLSEDPALYYKARNAVSTSSWATAIEACDAMTDGYLLEADVALLCASAYAGRCGFIQTTMLTDIAAYLALPPAPPADRLINWFMTTNLTATTAQQVSDCSTAMTLMSNSSTPDGRTDDTNAFVAMLALKTLGVTGKRLGDGDDNEVFDATDMCSVAIVSAADAQIIGAAFWELDKAVEILNTKLVYSDLDTFVDGVCTDLAAAALDLCGAATPAALGALPLRGARTILKEGAVIGFNQAGTNQNIAAAACP